MFFHKNHWKKGKKGQSMQKKGKIRAKKGSPFLKGQVGNYGKQGQIGFNKIS